MSRRAATVAILAVLALAVAAAAAPPGRAESEADVPRDPDFYQPPDIDVYHYVPMPDLASRPRPRDSRTLSGAFAPDPQGTLRVFTVGGGASSPCIGIPVSALCAVETVFQALHYHDDRLLAAGMGPFRPGPRFDESGPPDWGKTVIYRVYDVKVLGPDDLKGPRPYGTDPWYPRWYTLYRPWRAGDLQIQILYMTCKRPDAARCSSMRVPHTYTVREVAPGRWAILSGYAPRF